MFSFNDMKIAFIGQKGIPTQAGGIERHVENLALGLKNLGQEVFVYSRFWYTKSKEKNYKGINIINLPSINTKHLDAITHTFVSTVHALFCDYDVIHFHGVGPSLLSFIPRIFKPKAKVFATFHCIDRKHQKWSWFARFVLRLGEWSAIKFPNKTITVSKTLRQYCRDVYDSETEYIPNGVNIEAENNNSDILNKYNLEPNQYILMVSRLVKHKGAHYLIKAFNQINTNMKLVIVGGSSFTDSYVAELNNLAQRDSRVILTGQLTGEPLAQLYANALIFVQPSESEGLPIAVLEAMSYAKPVLVSNIPENLEVISLDKYGFSFKNKSTQDLSEKLEILINQKDTLNQVGINARNHVEKYYNWKDIVGKTLHLYEGMVVEKHEHALNAAV